MRLALWTAAAMTAFALNSLLTRYGVGVRGLDPGLFALIRVAAGAAILALLAARRHGGWRLGGVRARAIGAASLALYLWGFSFAYLSLETGLGALVLFGGVQVTMFAGAALQGEVPGPRRLFGAALALGGLALLTWPGGADAPDLTGLALMTAAAVGWGIYSLAGRGAADPLGATAANFALCLPLCLPLGLLATGPWLDVPALLAAVVSGAVTSGLGYALWYRVVPDLGASRAAVVQLSVPVIATLMGVALLGETLTLRLLAASALILAGIAIAVRGGPARHPGR